MRYKGIKGKAWEAVKRWSRRTFKDCYTCGAKNLAGQNAQAGHYWPVALNGSNNNRSWDKRFIRLQCGYCNGMGQGMQAIFEQKLIEELGRDVVEKYKKASLGKKVDPVTNWQAIIDSYED